MTMSKNELTTTQYLNPDEINVNPDLKTWIVSLTEDESDRLEKSILAEGCRDPIVVDTNGTIVDGHNRHRICKKHNLKIPVIIREFEGVEAVKNWMIENQLARRNVTPEQRNYLIGKLYNEKKQEHGGDRGNQYTEEARGHNDPLPKTSEIIAEEFNVGEKTVKRAAKFADAVDTIASQYGEEEKQKILNREVKASQKDVLNVAKKINDGMFSSETPEWYTPPEIIESVVEVFGSIMLDPCSNSAENPNVPASVHFTADDDGLNLEWHGSVYMNPPYGRGIMSWVEKLVSEYENGEVTEAIALVPARTDTAWFSKLQDYVWCAVRGRLKFSGSDNTAPFPSAVFYLGDNISGFYQEFSRHGVMFRKMSYEEGDVW